MPTVRASRKFVPVDRGFAARDLHLPKPLFPSFFVELVLYLRSHFDFEIQTCDQALVNQHPRTFRQVTRAIAIDQVVDRLAVLVGVEVTPLVEGFPAREEPLGIRYTRIGFDLMSLHRTRHSRMRVWSMSRCIVLSVNTKPSVA